MLAPFHNWTVQDGRTYKIAGNAVNRPNVAVNPSIPRDTARVRPVCDSDRVPTGKANSIIMAAPGSAHLQQLGEIFRGTESGQPR